MKPAVILRQWEDSDLEAFASMNADLEVMQFFPRTLTAEESRQTLLRFRQGIEQRGWGLWAIEAEGKFTGFAGLSEPKFSAHFTPCVEIGWRLRREYWGRGIAFAAARQAADYAFSVMRLDQLVSFTAATNLRSRKLMERLGFSHDPSDDFMHPSLEENHPLRHHVLYRKTSASGAEILQNG
ncbi:MAG: GNAT family N-acetyltransferase [Verrucomicrobiota bacterium]